MSNRYILSRVSRFTQKDGTSGARLFVHPLPSNGHDGFTVFPKDAADKVLAKLSPLAGYSFTGDFAISEKPTSYLDPQTGETVAGVDRIGVPTEAPDNWQAPVSWLD